MTSTVQDMSEFTPKPHKTIWWWIAAVTISLCVLVFLWWCGSYLYHLMTFRPTGTIVFSCRINRMCQINADGSGRKEISRPYIPLPAGISGFNITWSPDKKWIAFEKIDKTNNDAIGLFVADKSGSNEILIRKGLAFSPTWSPDGTKIAYTYYLGLDIGDPRIFVSNPDGSNQVQLTNSYASSPAWSPDGKKIAYHCGELCVMNADGSEQTQLTHVNTHFNYQPNSPSWSPDGQYIVYWQYNPACFLCPNSGELWIMKANGSQQTKLTDGPVDQNPVWSPTP